MSEFMPTDLPEPVVPATSMCGILDISLIMVLPPISSPTPQHSRDLAFLNSSDSNISLNLTVELVSLGTSTPTADLPGMGASIRISLAARASLISPVSEVMRDTLTPASGVSS